MIDLKSRVKEVLEQGYLLSLGTIDGAGVWVADVIYVSDEKFNIYWMSSPDFRHSKAIAQNPKVAGTITVSQNRSELDFAVQLEGVAEKLSGPQLVVSTKFLLKKGKPAPSMVVNILKEGYCWYKLTPTKIELIDRKNFGFERQTVK